MESLERRSFLKLVLAAAAVAVVGIATRPAEAMPAMPPHDPEPSGARAAEPAIATDDDLATATPEQVQWRWRWRRWRRWHWRRRWRWRHW